MGNDESHHPAPRRHARTGAAQHRLRRRRWRTPEAQHQVVSTVIQPTSWPSPTTLDHSTPINSANARLLSSIVKIIFRRCTATAQHPRRHTGWACGSADLDQTELRAPRRWTGRICSSSRRIERIIERTDLHRHGGRRVHPLGLERGVRVAACPQRPLALVSTPMGVVQMLA